MPAKPPHQALKVIPALLLMALATACARQESRPPPLPKASPTPILVLGDSLSSGHGLQPGQGWVDLLEVRLRDAGSLAEHQSIANASISGEISTRGRERLPALLDSANPHVVIIELGANDALRDRTPQSLQRLRENLDAMISMADRSGAKVVLVGLEAPGKLWFLPTGRFDDLFDEVAQDNGVVLVNDLLDGVSGQSELLQADRIHPNEKAQPRMLENAWPGIVEALSEPPH